ncbi:40S ribosomal protein S25, partial [Dictyocoela muelleri]
MVKKAPESKASKIEKITKSQNKQKKKWSSGTVKESTKRQPTMDEELFNKIQKDILNMKIVTKAVLAERYNINLYLCTNLLSMLEQKGDIKMIKGGQFKVYAGGKYVAPKEKIVVEVEHENNSDDNNEFSGSAINDGVEGWNAETTEVGWE